MSFLKEPFVHFALLGAIIFAWFSITSPEKSQRPAGVSSQKEITIDRSMIEAMKAQFNGKLNRNPTTQEMNGLIDNHIKTEIMVREAKSLGLDDGDSIVRNRLVQKMTFLATSAAQAVAPDDETLQTYLNDNAAQFESPARVSFEQYGLGETIEAVNVASVITNLENGKQPEVSTFLRFLPVAFEAANARQIDATFGKGFFEQITELPVGAWSGPIRSGFGYHLVRVNNLVPPSLPPLNSIRDKVLFDWQQSLAQDLSEAQDASLQEGYIITRPTPEELKAWISP